MEEKSIWHRVAGLVGGKSQGTLRELVTHTRRCPAGHPMAMDWTDCPYCKADRNSSPGTKVRQAVEPTAPDEAAALAATRIHGETRMAGRPLAGVVFTFSWTMTGQLFSVYAGRNYAGTAPVTRQGQPTGILLAEDPAMSGTHFLILYQQDTGQYRIVDENSTNGTFLNGEPIDSNGTELPDDAQILAGNTLFLFKKVRPPTGETERRPKGDYRPVAVDSGDVATRIHGSQRVRSENQ
jgi:FHA domain